MKDINLLIYISLTFIESTLSINSLRKGLLYINSLLFILFQPLFIMISFIELNFIFDLFNTKINPKS